MSDFEKALTDLIIEKLKEAFEAGRTVVNYKSEWQETYSDSHTRAKYKSFEDYIIETNKNRK